LALVAAPAVVLSTVPAGANEITLSAVNFVPNHTSFGIPFADWVKEVNAAGKGLVQIKIKASGSMSPFTMGNAVKTGVVDMANLPPTFYQNLLPVGDALKLSTKPPRERRKNGAWALMNKLHNEKVNAWYLTTWGYGVRFHLYLRDKKIAKPDLKGLKLRITPVYRAFFKSLGADLIQTKPADVYTALERGTIDGYGWPVWDIKSFGWDKVTKFRVDPGFYNTAIAIIVNLDKWKALSNKQRDFLTKHAIRLQYDFPKSAAAKNARYREEQKKAGVKVIKWGGETAEAYLRQSRKAGWAEVMKLDPVNGPKLRKLISDD
ncbi:MAG: TRAP transporter substrate-binding protein DctP, partial [Pseudomonadota bacterium]